MMLEGCTVWYVHFQQVIGRPLAGRHAKRLVAAAAARVVGVPRSTLYRWEKRCEPKSRRLRRPAWPSTLVQAVEELRADNPMWGKRKLAWLLRREGSTVSISMIGRILRSPFASPGLTGLTARGVW